VDHARSSKDHDDVVLRQLFDSSSPSRKTFSFLGRRSSVGLFQNRYITSPEGFLVYANRILDKAGKIVDKILNASTEAEYKAIVRHLDRLSDLLCRILDLSDFVRVTHPEPRYQEASAQAWGIVYQYMNQLNTMTGLNDQLVKAMSNPDVVSSWSEEERTVAEILQLDFAKSAVNLPKHARDKFVDISQQISQLGADFMSEMRPAKDVLVFPASQLRGLDPMVARQMTRRGNIYLPTIGPEAGEVLRSVRDADIRKSVYSASRTASRQTIQTLENMLWLRAELAKLAGFNSYGQMALKDRMMAKSPGSVLKFLEALNKHNFPVVNEEMMDLMREKHAVLDDSATQVDPWDRDLLMNRVRQQMDFKIRRSDSLPAYFSVGTVVQGFSRLFSRLFGIKFVAREALPGETWHEDVRCLDVVADNGERVAVLYCDLFYRRNKSHNPAHFTLRCSREISLAEIREAQEELETNELLPKFESAEEAANDGMQSSMHDGVLKQLPTIALVCDFPLNLSQNNEPALLNISQVETLFHEMGHAMHSVLARTSLQNVAGTRCATDLAELPSTLMEHFAMDPSVLSLYARHWKTDEPVPYEMVADRLRVTKRFEGTDIQNQLVLSMLDQACHSPSASDRSFNSTEVYHDLQAKYSHGLPDPPGTCWHGFFGHLHGYGSTYYSYLFDKVLAERVWKVVFAAGKEGGALNRENGEQLKESLLKWGGSRDPWRCLADTLQDERIAAGDDKAMALVGSWGIRDKHHT
jgi:mitochondrial intermediate peptidase